MNEHFFGFPGVGGHGYPPRQSRRTKWLLLRNGAAARFAGLWPRFFQEGLMYPNLDPWSQAGGLAPTMFPDPIDEPEAPIREGPSIDPHLAAAPFRSEPRPGPPQRKSADRRAHDQGRHTEVGGGFSRRSIEGSYAASEARVTDVTTNRVVACFGDFRHMIASQLSRPERISDSHLLSCDAHVYHAFAGVVLSAVIETLGCTEDDVGVLTRSAADRLGLYELAEEWRRGCLRDTRRRLVRPGGTLLYRLRVLDDPTVDAAPLSQDAAVCSDSFDRSSAGAAVEAPQPRGLPTPAGKLRREIPAKFLKPWETPVSREDAIYAMNVSSVFSTGLRRAVRGMAAWLWGGSDRRRWRTMLVGRPLDDQLWAIRPPGNALFCPRVRQWASSTLRLASYDVQLMLPEWEIYWRRKGL